MERPSNRQAQGTIETKAWDETVYDEIEGGAKLTRGQMTNLFHGDIEGEGKIEALMAYQDAGTVTFVGLERVSGRIEGHAGSFVIQHTGAFDLANGKANVAWLVIPGAGSGELRSLRGRGGYSWDRQQDGQLTPYVLEYELE